MPLTGATILVRSTISLAISSCAWARLRSAPAEPERASAAVTCEGAERARRRSACCCVTFPSAAKICCRAAATCRAGAG